ncbi:MAG: MucR family transcriptional regulator [Gammaproteobacteria bacterium]|nr:MucR family transcriptional regulator [Gammaproteobacteria bacterium]
MADKPAEKSQQSELLEATAQVVSAFLRNNTVPAGQLSDVIKSVHASLVDLGGAGGNGRRTGQRPAVPVEKSIAPNFIICLEDGKKQKMLKRHIRTFHNLTPDEYRTKWNLPAHYPMVAPSYAKQRSRLAKKFGLGRRARSSGRKTR